MMKQRRVESVVVEHGGDAYNGWTMAEIRKQCTIRGLKLPRGTRRDEALARMRLDDGVNRAYPSSARVKNKPTRGRNCIFRLLNVLFSDEFCERFACSGNTISRDEIDRGDGSSSPFWRDIAVAFQRSNQFRDLIADHLLFAGIDTSEIRRHSGDTLEVMWKEVNGLYRIAEVNFRHSGTHNPDFSQFVDKNEHVLYLWYWLQKKPNLTSFVQGGLFEADQFDSLEDDFQRSLSTPPPAKRRSRQDQDLNNSPHSSKKRTPKSRRQTSPKQSKSRKPKHDAMYSVASSVERLVSFHELEEQRRSFELHDQMTRRIRELEDQRAAERREHTDRIQALEQQLRDLKDKAPAPVEKPGGLSLQDRVHGLQLLKEIGTRIDEIEMELKAASHGRHARLTEDLQVALHQRQKAMEFLA